MGKEQEEEAEEQVRCNDIVFLVLAGVHTIPRPSIYPPLKGTLFQFVKAPIL